MKLLLPVLLFTVVALTGGHRLFSETIPEDYYQRRDLSDCSERFHKRRIFNTQCLIFGGELVNVTEFPHMAVLGWAGEMPNEPIRWMCGGSLITERFVLTAAHCASDDNNEAPRYVRLGDVNLASSDDDEYAQQFEIMRIIRHPNHRYSRKYFDLALVELNDTVRLSEGVCPGCLWTKHQQPDNDYETAGFGATSFGGSPIPDLLKARLHATDHKECEEQFHNTRGLADGIAKDQLCAANAQSDTCQGDSGGPLQVTLSSFFHHHPFIVGVTSFGRGCGTGSPGVYQLLADHIPWIESVVNETMNPLHCTSKYSYFRHWKNLIPECLIRDAYVSRVRILWPDGVTGSSDTCSGTLIDYNTVVTSARCIRSGGDIGPIEVELKDGNEIERTKIVEIQIHPGFRDSSYLNDVALLRLEKYLQPDPQFAPSCIALPETSEVCAPGQTHDPVACWDEFAKKTKSKLVARECNHGAYGNMTVRLVWPSLTIERVCVGMLIKLNTVISSISCMAEAGTEPPLHIELPTGERVNIVKILKHAGHKANDRSRDTALLLLERDLIEHNALVPFCIRQQHGSDMRYVSVHAPYGESRTFSKGDNVYFPLVKRCSDAVANNLTTLFDQSLPDGTRHTCWDVNRQVTPGVVIPEHGAGVLDSTHRFIYGLTTYATDYGSVEPIVTTNLTSYIDWITRFVLYRPPTEAGLVFRGDGMDEFELGSECTTHAGTRGNCMPEYMCEGEVTAHQGNARQIKICGFEDTISYICCPPEHQQFPLFQPIKPVLLERQLPILPYENYQPEPLAPFDSFFFERPLLLNATLERLE
ncbi:uncharacterized protein LOC126569312 [Anopheles aquasalis]|uniref:uncharacterized protein LOC126569312 n=1 Tax=Anopheles aquasalis TaxID=42839 RepID=UPI00215B3139|nr:uncharacterized protein LOC126569312 [Anopheles aquasalis]